MSVVSLHSVSGQQGTALAYFKVNESPSRGDCTIKPESGVEMLTDFRIFCKAWQDDVSRRFDFNHNNYSNVIMFVSFSQTCILCKAWQDDVSFPFSYFLPLLANFHRRKTKPRHVV